MTTGLAGRLRIETRALHSEAERSPFMAALLRGQIDRVGYVALLRNLSALYAALEPSLARHASHPAIAPLQLGALLRGPSLRSDLAALDDDGGKASDLAPTTRSYVAHLHELDRARPELLLAHAYVRYLGDLSGGQLLRRIVANALGSAGTAVSFYDFGSDADAAAMARAFRAGLELAVVDADAVVAEAQLSFRWHRRLFDELASAHGIAA